MAELVEERVWKKRKASRDNQAKQDMRDKISFTKTMKSIDEAEKVLLDMVKSDEEISNGKVGALKALLDSKWKKINKRLPDLKAIEHSGPDGEGIPVYNFSVTYE